MKLQELWEKCKNDHAAYDARNAKANAEYQAVQKAVEQAQQEAETALQANQGEAYTEALHRAEYSQQRAAYMAALTKQPYYPAEEYRALVQQIRSAASKEKAPLWEELNNVLIQGREIIRQLQRVADVESGALHHLTATVPYSPNRSDAEYPKFFSHDGVETALAKMFEPYGEAASIISRRLPKKGAK